MKIENYIAKAKASGQNLEEIARTAHSMRREIGVKYKDMTPDVLRADIYLRNMQEYGDELGPSFNVLLERGLKRGHSPEYAYEQILTQSKKSNNSLNNLLDLISRELP